MVSDGVSLLFVTADAQAVLGRAQVDAFAETMSRFGIQVVVLDASSQSAQVERAQASGKRVVGLVAVSANDEEGVRSALRAGGLAIVVSSDSVKGRVTPNPSMRFVEVRRLQDAMFAIQSAVGGA